MPDENVHLLVLSGGILLMMGALGVLKHLARRRAVHTRRAMSRLRVRSEPPARP